MRVPTGRHSSHCAGGAVSSEAGARR
jgi:hypothetical protein